MPTRKTTKIIPPHLIHSRRLIIASNRGPVEYQLTQDKALKARRGAGGMVTALIDVGNRMDVTWVAMTMTEGDRQAVIQAQQQGGLLQSPLPGQKMHLHYVSIAKEAYRKHYEKISNELLWFLQHYMYDPTQDASSAKQLQDAWENGYTVANQAIAHAVNTEIEREQTVPVVMLQDYHLYLAPAMIRQRHPTIVMQHFIHIPWPDVRCWHFFPVRWPRPFIKVWLAMILSVFRPSAMHAIFWRVLALYWMAQSLILKRERFGGKVIGHRRELIPFPFPSMRSAKWLTVQQASGLLKRSNRYCASILLCA
jgi:hypothetical protein